MGLKPIPTFLHPPLLRNNLSDLYFRKRLAVTDIAAVPDLWFVFHDRNFFGLAVLDNGRANGSPVDQRLSKLHFLPFLVSNKEDFKGDLAPGFDLKLLDLELLTFADLILLAAGPNDCEHRHLRARGFPVFWINPGGIASDLLEINDGILQFLDLSCQENGRIL